MSTLPAAASKNDKAAQKQKRDIVITSILLLIFAFTFTKNVLLRKPPAAPAPAEASAVPTTLSVSDQLVYVTNLRVTDQMRATQRAVWEKEWGRDPFVPQSLSAVVQAVNLTLQGVLWDEAVPKAIVNDKTLVVGDTLYGYTVENIKPRSVILKTGEKTIELGIFHGIPSSSSE